GTDRQRAVLAVDREGAALSSGLGISGRVDAGDRRHMGAVGTRRVGARAVESPGGAVAGDDVTLLRTVGAGGNRIGVVARRRHIIDDIHGQGGVRRVAVTVGQRVGEDVLGVVAVGVVSQRVGVLTRGRIDYERAMTRVDGDDPANGGDAVDGGDRGAVGA